VKLISVCTASHQRFKEDWLLPSLKDDYEVCIHPCEIKGSGTYLAPDWTDAVLFKSQKIIETIQTVDEPISVYADVDVQFFAPTKAAILEAMKDKDIVCQLDAPNGVLCTGFFAFRSNEQTLRLWQQVQEAIRLESRDQHAFNRIIREMPRIRCGYWPSGFIGAGTFRGKNWNRGEPLYVPGKPVMFHANCTKGIENKTALLERVRSIVRKGALAVRTNNLAFYYRFGMTGPVTVEASLRRGSFSPPDTSAAAPRPRSVSLDVATVCQLKCPSCPTAAGVIGKTVGGGFLAVDDFKRFVDNHPWISEIEISNWGEVFLHPELEQIIRYAAEKNVALRADNGANFNRVSDRVLEALVKYKFRSITCSVDGASQEVYSVYRVRGDFDRVIANIKKLNQLKRAYGSCYPQLRWQFVIFGHNEHQIGAARAMAEELGMTFQPKLSWDDLYGSSFSPVRDRALVSLETGLGVADRQEYLKRFGRDYVVRSCHMLWHRPQISYDGRVLGCTVNHWGDYGNAFEQGLEQCMTGEKMEYARQMLRGVKEAREDIPCTKCRIFQGMQANKAWIRQEDLEPRQAESRRMNMLINGVSHAGLLAFCRLLYQMAGRIGDRRR